VNSPARVFLKGQRLQNHESARLRLFNINEFVNLLINFEKVGVSVFTDFTLKIAPEHGHKLISLLDLLLHF
jgi:hypothetical protein